MHIVIASNINYYKITLPRLLKSLENSGAPREDTHVYISGSPGTLRTENMHYVTHISYEFTPLIELTRSPIVTDWIVHLHDTSEVGVKFWNNIQTFVSQAPEGTEIVTSNTMAPVWAYRADFLLREDIVSLLRSFENCSKSTMMANYKILEHNAQCYHIPTQFQEQGKRDVYGTGNIRVVEYYSEFDLYKYKRNWNQPGMGQGLEGA